MVSATRNRRQWAAVGMIAGLACTLPLAASAQTALKVGDRVSGEITSRSRINYNDGSRSDVYALGLKKDDTIALTVEGALCARLVVFDQGSVRGDSGRNQEGCDDESPARLSFRAPADGRYEVSVSGFGPRDFGPYRLLAERTEAYRGGPLRDGADITDLLSGEANTYTLEVAEMGRYVLDMTSSEFDSVLSLEGPGVEVEDDDGGGGYNARITALLEPGSYTLRARGLESSDSGGFNLAVRSRPLPEGVELRNEGPLELDGAAVTGGLGGSARTYTLQVDSRRQVTVELASEDFDTNLTISGQGTVLRDFYSGGEMNALIVAVLEPGQYTVSAGATEDSGMGLFTLQARSAAVPAGAGYGELRVGKSASASLPAGGKDRYRLSVPRDGQYRIAVDSDGLDVMVDVVRDGTVLVSDDDGGGDMNALAEAELEAGEYELVVSSWNTDGGTYTIKVDRSR